MTPKIQETKEKLDTLNSIKLTTFCSWKDTIMKVGEGNTEWEKIFVNHIFQKRLVSRIYGELLQFNNKKTNPI